jgi:hypothetical protein
MAYLKERMLQGDYNRALIERHPLMNSTAANAAGQTAMSSNGYWSPNTGAQMWPQAPLEPRQFMHNTTSFTVEKVDNGFILRSGKYSKVCKDMDELRDLFISIMVEQQLDK